MASAWPLLQRGRSNCANEALDAARTFLDEQLSRMTQLSKNNNLLETQGRGLQRVISDLKKTRDCIINSVDGLRIQYPQFNKESESVEEKYMQSGQAL